MVIFYYILLPLLLLLTLIWYPNPTTTTSTTATQSDSFDNIDKSLLTALLLLGRLAWLLQTRCGFLEYALQPPNNSTTTAHLTDTNTSTTSTTSTTPITGNNKHNASFIGMSKATGQQHRSLLSTEDQFRSAFEIADSNGDGILSFSEALEVIFFFFFIIFIIILWFIVLWFIILYTYTYDYYYSYARHYKPYVVKLLLPPLLLVAVL